MNGDVLFAGFVAAFIGTLLFLCGVMVGKTIEQDKQSAVREEETALLERVVVCEPYPGWREAVGAKQ